MLQLSESAAGLIIAYPLWIGVLCFAVGAALIAYAARPRAVVKRRFGILIVAGMLAFVGIYFGLFKVTLTPVSGQIYAFPSQDERMNWAEAQGASVITRNRGKGGPRDYMVVTNSSARELEIPLGGLDPDERQRVIGYVYSRMPR